MSSGVRLSLSLPLLLASSIAAVQYASSIPFNAPQLKFKNFGYSNILLRENLRRILAELDLYWNKNIHVSRVGHNADTACIVTSTRCFDCDQILPVDVDWAEGAKLVYASAIADANSQRHLSAYTQMHWKSKTAVAFTAFLISCNSWHWCRGSRGHAVRRETGRRHTAADAVRDARRDPKQHAARGHGGTHETCGYSYCHVRRNSRRHRAARGCCPQACASCCSQGARREDDPPHPGRAPAPLKLSAYTCLSLRVPLPHV